jgi:guanylate kinase
MIMDGKLIIISAPSGAGKTTIVKSILTTSLNLEFSISACSRPKRTNEINGKDYYFLTVEQFKDKIAENEFVEWEEVYKDHFYGTLKSEIERIWNNGNHVIFDVDVIGGLNIKKIYSEKALAIFIMPPSVEELERRLEIRSTETEESIQFRLNKAKQELTYAYNFDKIVVNDDLIKAIKETVDLISNFLDNQ